jgi:tetratricopeptide (TPR) repeat protein
VSKVKNSIGNIIKLSGIIALLLIAAYFATEFPKSSTIDFTIIRDKLQATVFKDEEKKEDPATFTEDLAPLDKQQKRSAHLDATRAKQYVESATSDYYQGSYEEALRRLERAKIYDPTNFSIFKLSGQIFFEKNKFRKAFNNWERATQLPNDDQTISRDIDVLKRLLRYSRNEIDRLQRTLNRDPQNRLVRARLKELEDQMRE